MIKNVWLSLFLLCNTAFASEGLRVKKLDTKECFRCHKDMTNALSVPVCSDTCWEMIRSNVSSDTFEQCAQQSLQDSQCALCKKPVLLDSIIAMCSHCYRMQNLILVVFGGKNTKGREQVHQDRLAKMFFWPYGMKNNSDTKDK